MNSEGFSAIKNEICNQLNITVNKKNIVDKVHDAAQQIRGFIKQELRNRLICLKIDSATKLERSVFCVNAQYIKNEIQIISLGVFELWQCHTSEYLKNQILKLLNTYELNIKQIYSCTSDNGANMVKCIQLLRNEQKENQFQNHLSEDTGVLEDDLEEQVTEDEETDEYDDEIENTENESNIDKLECSLLDVLDCVRCAPHTLQLCIHDVTREYSQKLSKIREVVKEAKSIKYKQAFLHSKTSKPKLDTTTRWNSTFLMLENLMENKTFYNEICGNFPNLEISAESWLFMEQFLEAFRASFVCCKKLQSQQLTMGDFYKSWLEMKIQVLSIAEKQNEMARKLIDALDKREKKLLDNEAFRSALYMDPRFNFRGSQILSEAHKYKAEDHLFKTWLLIEKISEDKTFQSSSTSSLTNATDLASQSSSINSQEQQMTSLDLYIGEHSLRAVTTDVNKESFIKNKIKSLCEQPRCLTSTNVLEYWANKEKYEPGLFALSQIVLSAPAAQVSVERAFSALGLVLTNLRSRLSDETLQNILLIKLNKHFLNDVDLSK